MEKRWTVPVDGKQYVIEVDYGVLLSNDEDSTEVLLKRDGKLVVNGQEVKQWEAGDLPKEISFEVGGQPAMLKKKGLFVKELELIVGGQSIKSS